MNTVPIQLILSGIFLSASIWVAQRQTLKRWLRIVLALPLLTLSVLSLWLGNEQATTLGPSEHWYDGGAVCELMFFLLMLVGMAARYVTKAIEVRRAKISELEKAGKDFVKPGLEFDAWEFSYPLFLSVVTYGALVSQMKDQSLTLANATLSFQTGFFWQTLLTSKQPGSK
jgi:hypothetical protein